MTGDQRLAALFGVLLILFAVWHFYRPTLKRIIFTGPGTSQGSTASTFQNDIVGGGVDLATGNLPAAKNRLLTNNPLSPVHTFRQLFG